MSIFDRVRNKEKIVTTDDNAYGYAIKKMYMSAKDEYNKNNVLQKGYNNKEKAILEPIFINDFYGSPIRGIGKIVQEMRNGSPVDIRLILKRFSSIPLLVTIIETRANQAMIYSERAKYSDHGTGFRVRLKSNKAPTKAQQASIDMAERYIENMGVDYSPTRPDFPSFLREFIRDTYTYDQVNYENTYDDNGNLQKTRIVDPTTIYYIYDKDKRIKRSGDMYAQSLSASASTGVIDRTFDSNELAMFIRNPRSDINSLGYGQSELEIGLKRFISVSNTEEFNDRFFTQGGTTRGIINIKADVNSSREQWASLRRQFNTELGGINSSWRLLVTSAEDVQFTNLTPNAQDIQFEKWLVYNYNTICALYGIDPAEIGMPNKQGPTGSKSNSLNEGNSGQKITNSKSKGLEPLMRMIANNITKNIIYHLIGHGYIFEFVGGDTDEELKKASLKRALIESEYTPNELRKKDNLEPVIGGDIIQTQFALGRAGQLMQQKQIELTAQQTRLQTLSSSLENATVNTALPTALSPQDIQTGFKGKPAKPSGKDNQEGVGKDGQIMNQTNRASAKEAGKNK